MSTQSTKHSTSVAVAVAAGVVLFSLLSPAMAAKQPSRSDLAFIGNPQGPTSPRTTFCRHGSASDRISMSNSIASCSSAAAVETSIPERNKA
jgi:hypothetical protein